MTLGLAAYNGSKALAQEADGHGGFYALLMAAMRRADTENARRLQVAFPEVWIELQARYDAPGGLLPGEAGRATVDAERRRRGMLT